jgi:hypothetical protein
VFLGRAPQNVDEKADVMKKRFGGRALPFVAAAVTLAVVCALHVAIVAAAETPEAGKTPAPYPRITTSICYEVDPAWPQRPEGVAWGEMAGVFVDAKDQIWLATRAEPPVQVYSAEGKLLQSFSGQQIAGQHAKTMMVHYLKIDGQNTVWLADAGNHCIWRFTPEGKSLMVLGTPGEPGCDATHLNKPTDVAIAPSGDIFVADGYGNARVAHFDKNGRFVKAWGKLGSGPGEFSLVHAIVMDSAGQLYVADRNNARVQVFDQWGKLLAQWRNLMVPWGLCMTSRDDVWVCGTSPAHWEGDAKYLAVPPKDQLFVRFDASGRAQQLWMLPLCQTGAEKPGELNWLHGIALDSHGNLYLADIKGHRAQKFIRRK